MQLDISTLDKWIPYKLLGSGDGMFCEWLYTGDEQFREAFFDETLSTCRRLPQNAGPQKNITDIPTLLERAKKITVAEPSAIMFHISRCGSTIVSQALANNINHIVLSEVPFFDDVLREPSKHAYGQRRLLKEVIKFYSRQKNGIGNKVFIKTDSWHIMFYKELRSMYPHVPFILLYRNPGEVVRSLNKKPGMHCIPQFVPQELLGIKEQVVTAADFYDYPIKVIEKYLEAYVDIFAKDDNAFLFNYNEGMLKVVADICKVVGVAFAEEDRLQMEERLKYHSKIPGEYFSPEPLAQSSSEKFSRVFELYKRLEGARVAGK